HPFAAATEIDVSHAIVAEPAVPPTRFKTDLPTALDSLILQMLEKAAGLRPSASEVETILTDLASGRAGQVIPRPDDSVRHTVGRAGEGAELRAPLATAVRGRGAMLCVAGEPGIGKTTLVEVFLHELALDRSPCYVGRGRCSERLAGTEAYLPFVEAL